MTNDGHEASVIEDSSEDETPTCQRQAVQVLVEWFWLVVPVVDNKVVSYVVSGDNKAKGLEYDA